MMHTFHFQSSLGVNKLLVTGKMDILWLGGGGQGGKATVYIC